MKFGQDLKANVVPEWAEGYIEYDSLKSLIRKISGAQTTTLKETLEEDFFLLLEKELEKVNKFYLKKVDDFEAALVATDQAAKSTTPTKRGTTVEEEDDDDNSDDDDDDDEDTVTATEQPPTSAFVAMETATQERSLGRVHAEIGQLQAFVWLNTQGFEKIMKKYDKFTGLRHTDAAKTPAFETRLRNEAFKSDRLDAVLERFKLLRNRLNAERGAVELKLISGSANKQLAEEVAARLGIPLSPAQVRRFNDGEINIQLCDSVRGCSVFILQPTCPPVNDHLVELLLLISAARRASAASVTAVVPYYGYARQDRKDRARVPISAADVARMMEAVGVDRVVCVDLHCAQIQGFFGPTTPVDNLFAAPIAVNYFHQKNLIKPVILSPDAGGVARAKLFMEGFAKAHDTDVTLAVIIKQRAAAGQVASMHLVGSVKDSDCIIVDDMIDTAGTLTKAADELKAFGAKRVFAFASHGLFSGPAADRIENCALEEVIVANTVPLRPDVLSRTRKIRQVSVGKLLEAAIRGIHHGTSVSALFDANVQGEILP